MNSIETEKEIRALELMLYTPTTFHSGACTRDLQQQPTDYIPPINSTHSEPEFLVEKYQIGADGEMLVLRGKQEPPLSTQIKRGYDFQI